MNLSCPNCQAQWGFDEIQFQQCDCCGWPDNDDDLDDDYDNYDDDEDEIERAMDECSKMPDGYCGAAGSEYCEFECPFRDD